MMSARIAWTCAALWLAADGLEDVHRTRDDVIAAGGRVSRKLVFRALGDGRGVFASGAIEPDEELVSVPRSAALHSGTFVREAPIALRDALDRIAAIGARHPLLEILFMAHQRTNTSSPWAHYFASLPPRVVGGALAMDADLSSVSAPMHEHLASHRELFDGMARLVSSAFASLGIAEDALRWAASMVLSRSFQLAVPDRWCGGALEEREECSVPAKRRVLLPIIDMFNHQAIPI